MGTSVNHPYFSPDELAFLCERQRGGKMSETQESKARIQGCLFIEAVSSKIGFPRATIGTAQTHFHRFYLFFPWRDFSFYDVSMASLYVSSKMHDTLKKPRDLLMVSYTVRFPELAAKAKHGGEVDIDPATLEADRRKLLAVERLVMETVSFNFRVRMPFPYVIKVARDLKIGKYLTKLAWTLGIDCHRTMMPLLFPPHVIAVASIYLAARLDSIDGAGGSLATDGQKSSQEVSELLGNRGPWEQKYRTEAQDLEEICHAILDVLLHAASNTASTQTSPHTPQTPASPSPNSHHISTPTNSMTSGATSQEIPLFSLDTLTRLKIQLREQPKVVPPRIRGPIPGRDNSLFFNENGAPGRNAANETEGTVRFLFGPEI